MEIIFGISDIKFAYIIIFNMFMVGVAKVFDGIYYWLNNLPFSSEQTIGLWCIWLSLVLIANLVIIKEEC